VRSMKWFVIILLLISLFVGAEQLGFYDWFETTKYGWILTDNTNPYNEFVTNETQTKGKILIVGNKVVPTTELDEEGLKIQEEQGCTACHK